MAMIPGFVIPSNLKPQNHYVKQIPHIPTPFHWICNPMAMIPGFAIPLTPKTPKTLCKTNPTYPYHFAQFTHFTLTRILYK